MSSRWGGEEEDEPPGRWRATGSSAGTTRRREIGRREDPSVATGLSPHHQSGQWGTTSSAADFMRLTTPSSLASSTAHQQQLTRFQQIRDTIEAFRTRVVESGEDFRQDKGNVVLKVEMDRIVKAETGKFPFNVTWADAFIYADLRVPLDLSALEKFSAELEQQIFSKHRKLASEFATVLDVRYTASELNNLRMIYATGRDLDALGYTLQLDHEGWTSNLRPKGHPAYSEYMSKPPLVIGQVKEVARRKQCRLQGEIDIGLSFTIEDFFNRVRACLQGHSTASSSTSYFSSMTDPVVITSRGVGSAGRDGGSRLSLGSTSTPSPLTYGLRFPPSTIMEIKKEKQQRSSDSASSRGGFDVENSRKKGEQGPSKSFDHHHHRAERKRQQEADSHSSKLRGRQQQQQRSITSYSDDEASDEEHSAFILRSKEGGKDSLQKLDRPGSGKRDEELLRQEFLEKLATAFDPVDVDAVAPDEEQMAFSIEAEDTGLDMELQTAFRQGVESVIIDLLVAVSNQSSQVIEDIASKVTKEVYFEAVDEVLQTPRRMLFTRPRGSLAFAVVLLRLLNLIGHDYFRGLIWGRSNDARGLVQYPHDLLSSFHKDWVTRFCLIEDIDGASSLLERTGGQRGFTYTLRRDFVVKFPSEATEAWEFDIYRAVQDYGSFPGAPSIIPCTDRTLVGNADGITVYADIIFLQRREPESLGAHQSFGHGVPATRSAAGPDNYNDDDNNHIITLDHHTSTRHHLPSTSSPRHTRATTRSATNNQQQDAQAQQQPTEGKSRGGKKKRRRQY